MTTTLRMNWEEEEQEEEIHEETIPFTQEIRTDHRSSLFV
jgi:hypothetical protein